MLERSSANCARPCRLMPSANVRMDSRVISMLSPPRIEALAISTAARISERRRSRSTQSHCRLHGILGALKPAALDGPSDKILLLGSKLYLHAAYVARSPRLINQRVAYHRLWPR